MVDRRKLKKMKHKQKSALSSEGQQKGTFYGQGELGGWYSLDPYSTGFQRNLDLPKSDKIASVYSAVMLNARAVSQCQVSHMKGDSDGAWTKQKSSPVARVLRKPNGYESLTLLLLNTVAETLFEGESLWYGVRDNRYVITEVHRIPFGNWSAHIDPDSNSIFYGVGKNANNLVDTPQYLIPARDCVHFRFYTPRHPLLGSSPAQAAAIAMGINVALTKSQLQFFSNMNRPSGILYSEKNLTPEHIKQLRTSFADQAKAMNHGEMPILGLGLKYQPLGIPQNDAQLIEQQRLSTAEIARVYGVPMALLSESSGPQGGTEALIGHWLSIGLGSIIESIERSLDMFFNLPINETIQLDTTPLMRADMQARFSALSTGIVGGILSPNEARAREHLPPIEGGDMVFMQRQQTPVNLLQALANQELENIMSPAQDASAQPGTSENENDDEGEPSNEDETKQLKPEILRAKILELRERLRVQ